MSIYLEFDKETTKFDLFVDGELISQFTPKEAQELVEEVSYLKDYHRQDLYTFNKLKLVDIVEKLEDENKKIEDVIAIELSIEKLINSAPETTVSLKLRLRNNDGVELTEVSEEVADNFEDAKIWFGQISTHEMRECLHESVLVFLKENDDVEFSFGGKTILKEYLFNADKVQFFEAGENKDT